MLATSDGVRFWNLRQKFMCGSLTANVFDEDLFFGDYHYLKELTWLIRHV